MVNVLSAFPSNFLRAADLSGQEHNLTVLGIRIEDVGGEQKPVVYFQERPEGPGLALNKTNANNIADHYGQETDGWIGRGVILYPTKVDFQGRTVDAIRVRVPIANPNQPLAPAAPLAPPSATAPAPLPTATPVATPALEPAAPANPNGKPFDDAIPF